jgi:anti-sigma-K factor RskA
MTHSDPFSETDRDALAGELALGLLEGEDRAAALRLMLADREFAAKVEQWRAHQSGLFDAIGDVEPPVGAWQGIAARIGAANDSEAVGKGALRWWRAGALGSGAVAATLALMLLLPRSEQVQPTVQPFAVAQLTGPIAGLRIATRYDPATAILRVRASGMPATPTEPELWIVPGAGGTPVSLGQIDRDGETVITVAEGHRGLINGNARFSLSMEPPSQVPSQRPSADFVADGAIDVI